MVTRTWNKDRATKRIDATGEKVSPPSSSPMRVGGIRISERDREGLRFLHSASIQRVNQAAAISSTHTNAANWVRALSCAGLAKR